MKRYLLKQVQISDIRPADLNGDGKANSTDYQLLKRYILKTIDIFPVENRFLMQGIIAHNKSS